VIINTTLGWGGVFDVATGASLPQHQEDFGQTLGWWGVPPGPYLVIPLVGVADLRDAPSKVIDEFLRPLHWWSPTDVRWGSLALSYVDERARLLPSDKALSEAFDPYAFVRESYLQHRRYEVYDGNPPEEPLDLEDPEGAKP